MVIVALTPVLGPGDGRRGIAQQGEAEAPATGITLLRAWDVIAERLLFWQDDAVIVELTSTADSEKDAEGGQDGKQREWVARARSPKAGLDLVISIADGRAGEAWEDTSNGAPALIRPSLDSPDAYAAALTAIPELGAGNKSGGIGFGLGL